MPEPIMVPPTCRDVFCWDGDDEMLAYLPRVSRLIALPGWLGKCLQACDQAQPLYQLVERLQLPLPFADARKVTLLALHSLAGAGLLAEPLQAPKPRFKTTSPWLAVALVVDLSVAEPFRPKPADMI